MKYVLLYRLSIITCLLMQISNAKEKIYLVSEKDSLVQLQEHELVDCNGPVKLHLGCGESYLPGYINIDYPPADHTCQMQSVADAYANVTELLFPPNSIDVIESHHMFEHFDRQTALALLCAWYTWLKPGGKIVIETPDFHASIRTFLNQNLSYKERQVVVRHIFGSHEAHWAYHYDGWYKEKFEHVLSLLGFSDIKFSFITYHLIPSILVSAHKTTCKQLQELVECSKTILYESTVAPCEQPMWQIWCQALYKKLSDFGLYSSSNTN